MSHEPETPGTEPTETDAIAAPAVNDGPPAPALPEGLDEDAAAWAREAAEAAAAEVLAEAGAGTDEAGGDGAGGDEVLRDEALRDEAGGDEAGGDEAGGDEAGGEAAMLAELEAAEIAAELPETPSPSSEETLATAAAAIAEVSEGSATVEEQALEQAEARPEPGSLEGETPAEIDETVEAEPLEKLEQKAKKLTAEQARHVLHAILFVSDKPLTVDQLKAATGFDGRRIHKALDKLAGELREGVSGVVLSEIAGAWQLRTAPEASDYVRRFLKVKPRRLTRAALETLAIIAYRQPATRPEVEEIRGVDCGAVMKALTDWKLVKVLGRKDEVGRPLLYGTTPEFLEFFQLKDLSSLPTLREYQELTRESREIVEEEFGPEPAAIAGTVEQLADPAWLAQEEERVQASEAALAELEEAMRDTDERATVLARTLSPPKPGAADAVASDAKARSEVVQEPAIRRAEIAEAAPPLGADEPIVAAEAEPVVAAEAEPVVAAEAEPVVAAEAETILAAEADAGADVATNPELPVPPAES